MAELTIDGVPCQAADDATILDVARAVGIDVPALCSDPYLNPIGACRMCMVSIEGNPAFRTACSTRVQDGMVVHTTSEDIHQHRETLLTLLAEKYPSVPVTLFPEKPFHALLRQFNLVDMTSADVANQIDDSHATLYVNMAQCIVCYRCVEACKTIPGLNVWRVWNRGDHTRIVPDSETNLMESTCISCGACAATCPTGAIEDKRLRAHLLEPK